MRVLGIDPGSWTTGWGLVGGTATQPIALEFGRFRLEGATLAARLARLQSDLDALVVRLAPNVAAVESAFHGANPRSALQLAHARGVILAVLAGRGLDVIEYTPATVKKSVTGNGRASKDQVQGMVRRLLGGRPKIASADAADALAVALCHAVTARYHVAVQRAVSGQR